MAHVALGAGTRFVGYNPVSIKDVGVDAVAQLSGKAEENGPLLVVVRASTAVKFTRDGSVRTTNLHCDSGSRGILSKGRDSHSSNFL